MTTVDLLTVALGDLSLAVPASAVAHIIDGDGRAGEAPVDVAELLGVPDGSAPPRLLICGEDALRVRGAVRMRRFSETDLLPLPDLLRHRVDRAVTRVVLPGDGPAILVLDPDSLLDASRRAPVRP